MEEKNGTSVTEFLLVGLTKDPQLQILLFLLFMIIYIITLLGNLTIILLIHTSPHLHTPMYFFLSNLSFVDFCYSTVITPNMMLNLLSKRETISYNGCAAQLFFFAGFACTEIFLLSVMAYDRYVAICNPLLYSVIMTKQLCSELVIGSYLGGFVEAMIQTSFTFSLSFCRFNVINQFYCDVPPLLKLSCTDTFINEIIIFVFAVIIGVTSLVIILISYSYILSTVVKIDSVQGRRKAFSTCASHFTCVIFFYGTLLFVYLQPSSGSTLNQNGVISIFYTVVIPMLNPLIYSLRNQEVKISFRSTLLRQLPWSRNTAAVLSHF
ncbi:olfactory receptor 1019-like [Microcaecilia unicolor]|uniref:Olfactory receptor n=1 Tax=Microcaecilia unicolor TaxID=1415580 RepID=A0A6P7X082_9AMPH|nr:olfactory receptor 1019-like [Microcaecilia unicolor]